MLHKKPYILMLCLLGMIAGSGCASHTPAAPTGASPWTYAIDNTTEKTTREYLLVYAPGTPEEKQVSVRSDCRKPLAAEGAYGSCTHTLSVQPPHKKFDLATGEDVVLVQFTWGAPLVLATIEYGCCAGHDTFTFYSATGASLGSIITYGATARANSGSLLTRTFDPGTGTRDGDSMYLLVRDDGKPDSFHALVFKDRKLVREIPVVFPLPDRDSCGEWYIDKFIKYGDREYLSMLVKGMWCLDEDSVLERPYRCSAGEKAITCAPETAQKKPQGP